MTSLAEKAGVPDYYASSTRRRMRRLIARLQRMQPDDMHTLDGVFRELLDQQDESHQAGFKTTADLCGNLAVRLARIRTSQAALRSNELAGHVAGCRLIWRQVEAAHCPLPARPLAN